MHLINLHAMQLAAENSAFVEENRSVLENRTVANAKRQQETRIKSVNKPGTSPVYPHGLFPPAVR